MKQHLRGAIAAFVFVPIISHGADLRSRVEQAVVPLMKQYDIPGMSVALTIKGKVHIFNYGLASRAEKAPVTEATLFELGSISKVFAGMLALQAADEGKLDLADHPSTWMPGLKRRPIDQATILNLATYTAGGLPLQFPRDITRDKETESYFHNWKAAFPAGERREYSNPSIGLLGQLTAAALKQPFAQAMETRLLPALGLKSTYLHVPPSAMPHYAWGYDRDTNKAIRMNPGPMAGPAYGLRSSAADMIRFVQLNLDPSRLDARTRRVVEATQVGHFQVGPMRQGVGWERYDWPAPLETLLAGNSESMIFEPNQAVRIEPPAPRNERSWYNKTGSTGGFGNYVAFVPSAQVGVVMLANKNYPIPERIKAAHAILAAANETH